MKNWAGFFQNLFNTWIQPVETMTRKEQNRKLDRLIIIITFFSL